LENIHPLTFRLDQDSAFYHTPTFSDYLYLTCTSHQQPDRHYLPPATTAIIMSSDTIIEKDGSDTIDKQSTKAFNGIVNVHNAADDDDELSLNKCIADAGHPKDEALMEEGTALPLRR
jgi:hypothetical protein